MQRQHRLHINPRRRHQRCAKRQFRRIRGRRGPQQPARRDDPAHQELALRDQVEPGKLRTDPYRRGARGAVRALEGDHRAFGDGEDVAATAGGDNIAVVESFNVNDTLLNDLIRSLEPTITKRFYSWRKRATHRVTKLAGGELGRYISGHAAKDIHEKFYVFHELPDEFAERVQGNR